MKHRQNRFLSFLLIIIAVIAFFFIAYISGSFPIYNNYIDRGISFVKNLFSSNESEKNDDTESSSPETTFYMTSDESEIISKIDLSGKKPVFYGAYTYTPSDKAESSSNHGLKDFDRGVFSIKTEYFTYNSEWKYISDPFVAYPYFALFTGEPQLHLFHFETGLIYNCALPVYPDQILLFDSDSLVFSGRDGNTYRFLFKDEEEAPLKEKAALKSPKELFTPEEKCQSAIKARLDMWTDKKLEELPSISFFPASSKGLSSPYDIASGLAIYAYSPVTQGKYKVGFMDENGKWEDCHAFVFVFLSDGEMLSMSFEYYADKPYVEVSLSDKELYYFVYGSIQGVEIPENTRVGIEGPLS